LIFITVILILIVSACSLPTKSTTQPTAFEPSVVTKGIPTFTLTPSEQPEIEVSTDTPEPTETPSLPPSLFPAGFVTDPGDGERLIIYNPDGEQLAEVSLPGKTEIGSQTTVHVSGTFSKDTLPPIVYISNASGGSLQAYENGDINTVVLQPNISYLIGAAGTNSMVYTTSEFQENSLESKLYFGNIENLADAEPVLVRNDPAGWGFRPLAIAMNGDLPEGVWYTLAPWGYGGDIVFEPQKGIYYLNLLTNQIQEQMDPSVNPVSFSPDLTWLTYTHDQTEQPLTIMPMSDPDREFTIALAQDSDRGAGNAVFSPDNRYIAWMEASGMRLTAAPDFKILIRIASTSDGELITEFPATVLADVLDSQDIQWVEPVGWLDQETLLIQVNYDTWSQFGIVSVKFDGSEMTVLAPGNFAGFLYP